MLQNSSCLFFFGGGSPKATYWSCWRCRCRSRSSRGHRRRCRSDPGARTAARSRSSCPGWRQIFADAVSSGSPGAPAPRCRWSGNLKFGGRNKKSFREQIWGFPTCKPPKKAKKPKSQGDICHLPTGLKTSTGAFPASCMGCGEPSAGRTDASAGREDPAAVWGIP